ncbi:QueT transporter family protein [Priestia endophytica]|jgi:uncharacterized membrane protein|uniref:QueT transporter family protein n=1 Tax=Priestia endophytica TaxID=135735 RepID=UPI000F53D5FC|nr:QueT transporter family protein [Priestia endophytica]RPJ97609.1 hypothetical protein FH5_04129 [Priestia endophytica]
MNIRTMSINALVAALYIAVSLLIQPFGFTNIQFRLSEMFNHLVVFNKKYIFGIVIGVFLTNLLFSPLGAYDLVFGVLQSLIALLVTIGVGRYIKNLWARMMVNTAIFTATMFIIAFELHLALGLPFLFTWLTTAVGEFVVMFIGAFIMMALNKKISFKTLLN